MKLTAIFTDAKGRQYRPIKYGEAIRKGDLRLTDFTECRASKLPKSYVGRIRNEGYGPMLTPIK